MAKKRVPRLIVAHAARQDIIQILQRSERIFGEAAADRYSALIKQSIRDIGDDPERPGSQERPEVMVKGVRTYHLQFSRRRVSPTVKEPRHFLLYRRGTDGVIEVARVLDDVRDLARHLPEDYRRSEPGVE